MSEHSSRTPENKKSHVENNSLSTTNVVGRRERPSRACTQRAAARLQAAVEAEAEAALAEAGRKRKKAKKVTVRLMDESKEEEEEEDEGSCSKIVTELVGEPEPSQLLRWNIRSMWQLASILNFLNVFRPLLNVKVEFSAEEFETALISPNNTLADIHMPLLKAISPVTRMALGHNTWVTVLCRKFRDWWHWVVEGDFPIVASHGAEIEAYKALDPGVRVVILKALCDIRVQQEDIRSYMDDSIKHGVQLSLFRKERLGGDSHGISYWYEEDPIIGHRLYREIRKVEVTKGKGKNVPPIPHSSYQWEAVATNLDEFQVVSEKLFSSKNRTEVSVGKKLKNIMLPEIEKVHKRKEKLLKKQHRQSLMLDDSLMHMDGLAGRSRRDRKKPVTYTFDDYDRSISEAIKVTKYEPFERRDPPHVKLEVSKNGRRDSHYSRNVTFSALSPNLTDEDEFYEDDQKNEILDRSNRRRQRPQRYSAKEFVEAVSDNEADFYSDDDIVGEVVYDDEYYLKKRKEREMPSSSSEEYHLDDSEKTEDEEEEDDENNLSSTSEGSDAPPLSKFKKLPRRETKFRRVQSEGLRRSKRATRNRLNYRQIEILSESETESKSNASLDKEQYNNNAIEFAMGGQDYENNIYKNEVHHIPKSFEEKQQADDDDDDDDDDGEGEGEEEEEEEEEELLIKKRRFLDLNELAPPGSRFDDGPNPTL